ncbi:MAG: DUF3185 family protein [Phycisphaeraceae bacterium]|nr:MAG: DUF3185 family protein [Phycisphaeraceae bacterium]
MSPIRIIGIVLVVVGIILLIVGFNASESFVDQASNFFTGKFTDSTMWYLVGGAAALVGGVLVIALGGRTAPMRG